MSFSQVTLLSLSESSDMKKVFRKYSSKRISSRKRNESSFEDWSESERKEVERGIDKLLSEWKSEYVVFGMKYLDNGSVAASQVHNTKRLLKILGVPCIGVLQTERYSILGVVPLHNTAHALNKGYRRALVRTQPSERLLWFNLTEACATVMNGSKSPMVIVVHEILGPTRNLKT